VAIDFAERTISVKRAIEYVPPGARAASVQFERGVSPYRVASMAGHDPGAMTKFSAKVTREAQEAATEEVAKLTKRLKSAFGSNAGPWSRNVLLEGR
jgi:hypothetical protein